MACREPDLSRDQFTVGRVPLQISSYPCFIRVYPWLYRIVPAQDVAPRTQRTQRGGKHRNPWRAWRPWRDPSRLKPLPTRQWSRV